MYTEVIIASSTKEVDRIFYYKIPECLKENLQLGMRVVVPFGRGNKEYEAFIIGFSDSIDFPQSKLKTIIKTLGNEPFLLKHMIELARFMKEKYFATMSDCLKCIIPSGLTMKDDLNQNVAMLSINKDNENYLTTIEHILKKESSQSKVLRLLLTQEAIKLSSIMKELKVSISPIKTLLKNKIITLNNVVVRRKPYFSIQNNNHEFSLTNEQQNAVEVIKHKIETNNIKPTLLHGVTGSGKTEVYLRLIESVLAMGKQIIVLVPEISLTPQACEIFIGRFGELVSLTHSRLTSGERFDQWEMARNNQISIMIGPRSAIFTPFSNLGLVIIDEEHEHTYKSETSPKYDTREVAKKLCELTGSHLVIASATPSLESYFAAKENAMDLVELNQRVNESMPLINIVDMRNELACGNRSIFSYELMEAMKENFIKNEQTILFLNRRGHSTFVSCRKCGYVLECDSCNVNFTYHITNNSLICHYCGKVIQNPDICPVCGSKYIKYFGVGTQKIEDEIKKIIPEANVLRMDMDTTSKKFAHEKILGMFKNGDANILIGTQMIAKGLDFPNVTLVGVISADVSLNMGDFRSGELTYQILTQVSGRAGRSQLKGRVFIQTYNPEHYSIKYAKENNYKGFYEHEISLRRQMAYPPFTKMFSLLFTCENEKKLIIVFYKLLDIMKYYNKNQQFETIGPSPAVVSKIKNNYRWRLLVKSLDEEKLKNYVLFCVDKLKKYENTQDIHMNLTLNPIYT